MQDPSDDKSSANRSSGHYELPEIRDRIACPSCSDGTINLKRTIYRLPDGEDIIIMNMECPDCGYHRNDIISLYSAFKPGEYRLKVDDADFTHKIFRGTSGDIEIPEIGVNIERGPAAEYILTNVEGILLSIQDQIKFLLKNLRPETKRWENASIAQAKLTACLSGEMPFTVILRDTMGGSYISPNNKEKMHFIPLPNE